MSLLSLQQYTSSPIKYDRCNYWHIHRFERNTLSYTIKLELYIYIYIHIDINTHICRQIYNTLSENRLENIIILDHTRNILNLSTSDKFHQSYNQMGPIHFLKKCY